MRTTDHILCLTIRFDMGSFHRDTDLTVPANSTLGELIHDVAILCNAPPPDPSWEACSAAGVPLDMAAPLAALGVDHGDVIVIQPRRSQGTPVVHEAAEALSDLASHDQGLPAELAIHTVTLSGWIGLGAAVFRLSSSFVLSLGLMALGGLLVVLWCRFLTPLFCASALVAGVATACWAASSSSRLQLDIPALACGFAVTLMFIFGGALLKVRLLTHPSVLAGLGVLAVSAAVGLCSAWLVGSSQVPPVLLASSFLCTIAAPAVSASCAGLRTPELPSAGQSLEDISPEGAADATPRAVLARQIYTGVMVGVALVSMPCLLLAAVEGGLSTWGLCLALAVSYGLHGLRHSSRVVTASCLAVSTVALAVAPFALGGSSPWLVVASIFLSCLLLSIPLWMGRLRGLQPTQMVWWERLESVALIATVPLLAHSLGLFELVRGLG